MNGVKAWYGECPVVNMTKIMQFRSWSTLVHVQMYIYNTIVYIKKTVYNITKIKIRTYNLVFMHIAKQLCTTAEIVCMCVLQLYKKPESLEKFHCLDLKTAFKSLIPFRANIMLR